ncbi:hypothetical protein [Streptomyces sp. NPDC055506]
MTRDIAPPQADALACTGLAYAFGDTNAVAAALGVAAASAPAGSAGPLIFTRRSDVRHASATAFSDCFRITAGHGLIADQMG